MYTHRHIYKGLFPLSFMTNAPRMLQERRLRQINQITASLKKHLETKPMPVKKDFVLSIMANLNLSKRTASEYADVVAFKLGVKFSS